MRWLVVAVIFVVVFGVFSTVYAAAAKRSEVRVLPKWVWVLMCAFIPLVGGLLYLTLGRPIGPTPPMKRGPQTKVVAPDDDPNFLRDLKRKLDEDKPAEEKPAEDKPAEDKPTDAASENKPEADSATGPAADSTEKPEDDSPEAGSGKN
jgi:hypothetical protein